MKITRWSKSRFLFIFFLIPFLISISPFCSRDDQNKPILPKNFTETAGVIRKEFSRMVSGHGFIVPFHKENILAYNQGKIIKIWVKEGEEIRQGENLISIRGLTSIHEIDQIKSRFESTKAEYERMQKKIKRSKKLEKEGATYEREKEEIYANYKKALALYNAAKREHDFYTSGLVIKSPIDGIVTEFEKFSGRTVAAGEFLLSIISCKKLLAEVKIFNDDSYLVKPGQKVIISNQKERCFGNVYFVSKILERNSGARRVGIEIIQEKPGKFLPGDFVKSEIIVEKHYSLAIPQDALLSSNNQAIVIVKVGEKYKTRNIVTGLLTNGYVEIISGLMENEEIVTKGAYELLNRDIVKKIILED